MYVLIVLFEPSFGYQAMVYAKYQLVLLIYILVIRYKWSKHFRKASNTFNIKHISDIFISNLLCMCPICYKLLSQLMNISYSKCLNINRPLFLAMYSQLIMLLPSTIHNYSVYPNTKSFVNSATFTIKNDNSLLLTSRTCYK